MAETTNPQHSSVYDSSDCLSLFEWGSTELFNGRPVTYDSDDSCDGLYDRVYCKTPLNIDLPADSMSDESSPGQSPNWNEDFETMKANPAPSITATDSNDSVKELFVRGSEVEGKCPEVVAATYESDSNIYDSITKYSQDSGLYNDSVDQTDHYQFLPARHSFPPKLNVHKKVSSNEGLNKFRNLIPKGITENSKKKKQQKKWKIFKKSVSSVFIETPDILDQQFMRAPTVHPTSSTDENLTEWCKTNKQSHHLKPPSCLTSHYAETTIGSNEQPCEDRHELIAYQGSHDSDASWGSDEFDSSSFSYESEEEDYSTKPLPPLPSKKLSADPSQAPGLIEKIRNLTSKEQSDSEDESLCLPVTLRPEKFRPPNLPPAPTDLTCNQIKRRCVVECIILSEKSYIESLQRIIQDYEEPILELIGVQKMKIRNSLKKLREILNYHHMFQIELAERVNCWDEKETIGDIFMASFSKSMVFDAYSIYVNNFSATMEEIKNLQRTRQSFRDFLKQKETASFDRLSIFGLMVKPIQRFPQFIMCLQDLLKYTPKEHVDRRALQLAVTVLENLAHKLNEHKRENEQKFAAKQILTKIREGLTKPQLTTENKFLIRQDDMLHIVNQAQPMKSKKRRIFMLNDSLICVNVMYRNSSGIFFSPERERDGEVTERYKHKWTVPLKNVEFKVNSSSVHNSFSLWTAETIKMDSFENDSQEAYETLCDMNHDYRVLEEINKLISSLKCSYEILTEELLHEIQRDLQFKIQEKHDQINLVDGCSIELMLPDKSGKVCVLLQALSPAAKQNWCLDFQIAKLALSPQNQPGWDIPMLHHTDRLTENLPVYFVSSLPIDVSTHSSQVQCAIGVYLPSGHMGVPHVWVCNTAPEIGGQVSIISVQTSQNILTLTESFPATSTGITCVEKIPGTGVGTDLSSVDTVWMATVDQQMYVYELHNAKGGQRKAIMVFSLPAVAQSLKYTNEKLFVALDSGSVLIFNRQEESEKTWDTNNPQIVDLDTKPVTCLLDSSSDGCILAACSNTIYVINQHTGLLQSSHKLAGSGKIEQIVPAGVGLWVSYQNSSIIHLYHIENLELLQEINVSSAGTRVSPTDSVKECTVTCLLAGRGMLWIGTNVGLLLSFQLPRLRDGVPIISGRPYVSYHGHKGAIKFLLPFTTAFKTKSNLQQSPKHQQQSSEDQSNVIDSSIPPSTQKELSSCDSKSPAKKIVDCSTHAPLSDQFQKELKEKLTQRYRSAPNLLDIDIADDVQTLYGSLMRGAEHALSRTQSLLKRPSRQESMSTSPLGTLFGYVSSPAITASNAHSKNDDNSNTNNCCSDLQAELKSEKSAPNIISNKNSVIKNKISSSISYPTQSSLNYREENNSNSVIIVSGGNGYQCWNNTQNVDQHSKDNNASLLFWIYKQ